MKAIILAAGRGTRMAPLTDTIPKPMLTVLDKNLIEWKLEALPDTVDGIILVVGYKKEAAMDYFGNIWRGIPVTYVEQKELNGTGGAILLCEPYITDKALVLMGDDIYAKSDLQKLFTHTFAMLVHDGGEEALLKKGQIVVKDGLLFGIKEGDTQTGIPSTLLNTGACVISKEYFNYPPVKFSETEYGLPHTLVSMKDDIGVHIVQASQWIQITSPECIQKAEMILS